MCPGTSEDSLTAYTILNIAGINAQTIHMLNSNVKIRNRIFIRSLIMQLVSEQIKKCSEISTGVHKPLHLQLHQFQTQIEGNSTGNTDMVPLICRKRKRRVRCYASKISCLSKYFYKCCEKYLCFEYSNTVCNDC